MPSQPTIFDIHEDSRWTLTGAASQNAYTQSMAEAMDCVDNWGFFEKEVELPEVVRSVEDDEGVCPLKLTAAYGLNMYRFLVTDGLPPNALQGKQLLEVGSGRGKGAAYIAQ